MSRQFLTDIDLTGNQILNAVIQVLAADPGTLVEGRLWFNSTDNVLRYYDGTQTVDLTEGISGPIDADTLEGFTLAQVLARANHTGTQLAATISDFNAAADARVALGINAVIDAAPGTLDTLNELAAALGDDPNFATTIANSLATKATKYTTTVGDGVARTFNVDHNLNNRWVTVQTFLAATGEQIECDITLSTVNRVIVGAPGGPVPTAGMIRVVITG